MKRLISLFLTILLIISSFPLAALPVSAATYTGSCGDNLTWTLDNNGTLTISGIGTMKNYAYSPSAPWGNNIKTVVIEDGVTSIGDFAFHNCLSLTSITIPDSVINIGDYAFYNCTFLTSITIPDSVTNIGEYAFDRCSSLTSIIIPDSVTSIGKSAFYKCDALTSVLIGDSVTYIGDYAFSECTSLESIAIPDNVTSIDHCAFYSCTSLSSITLPDSLTIIGASAFYNTAYYNNDSNWENGVLYISEYLIEAKTSISGDYTIREGTKYMADSAFNVCTSLTSITIPDSVTSIGNYAFSDCYSLASVKIGDSVTSIGVMVFYFCRSLTTVEIGNSVTSIGGLAFTSCTSLTDVYYSGTEEEWNTISIDDYNDPLLNATIHFNSENNNDNNIGIAVFTTEKSLSVEAGKSFRLGFGLMNKDGLLEGSWKEMAITVSDPTIISLSEYSKMDFGYVIDVTGKKAGSTNVTITDTESGANLIITISVYDEFVSSYSYTACDMEEFYPNNKWEDHLLTNIYNLNGLYVNNYTCIKNGDKYSISFDVYNSKYHMGSVDIYDSSGNWKGSHAIEKQSNISSLWDTGEEAFFLITNTIAGLIPGGEESNLMTYEQEAVSEHTHISFTLSEGESFTISNNPSQSYGAYLYNMSDLLINGTNTVVNGLTFASEFKSVKPKDLAELLMKKLQENPDKMEVWMEVVTDEACDVLLKLEKNISYSSINTASADILAIFEDLLNKVEIDWVSELEYLAGIGEGVLKKAIGPAGFLLEGCFTANKIQDLTLQIIGICGSSDQPYASIYTSIEEGYITGRVVVNTNGNMDSEAILQVFRVSNDGRMDSMLDPDNNLEKYELYNISFVKNDKQVQPSGKVKVYIPIPEGMKSNTCNVYRQEDDGSWTVLDAHIEGNYLVFETEHFSYYAVIGDVGDLTIKTLPNKLSYVSGDTLDTEGLTLAFEGETITSGFLCGPTVMFETGEQTITVKYGKSTCEFTVNVRDNTIIFGDTDDNGRITIADVLLLRKYLAGIIDEDKMILDAADVDGNGRVTIADVLLVRKYLAGVITEFPAEK